MVSREAVKNSRYICLLRADIKIEEGIRMEAFETLLKKSLLFIYCILNIVDMIQTVAFLEMGIESNFLAVHYPQLWFPFKFIFTFGFPIGLYKLDGYLEKKEDEGPYDMLRSLVGLLYLSVLVADVVYLSIVLNNMSIMGRYA